MKLGIINTGGTISCVGRPLSPMDAETFALASERLLLPSLQSAFPGVTVDFIHDRAIRFTDHPPHTLDSTDLQPQDWVRIADYILNNYTTYDGWIILHGTDTMSFTGGALPFLLNQFEKDGTVTAALDRPVILTGSQLPLYALSAKTNRFTAKDLVLHADTDAYQNICGAIRSALSHMNEVGIFFNNRLLRANRCLKVNAGAFAAFESPNYPELARSGIDFTLYSERILPGPVTPQQGLSNPETLKRAQKHIAAIAETIKLPRVVPFTAFPAPFEGSENGTSLVAQALSALGTIRLTGLILQSYGAGNFPSGNVRDPEKGAVFKALNALKEDGVQIVNCSQVAAGRVDDGAYAAGAWLRQLNMIPAREMTPPTALSKLLILQAIALDRNWEDESVAHLMRLNLFGENCNFLKGL